MANGFLTAEQISKAAIALLTRTLVLPMTVVRVPGEDFQGGHGDTVTIRVPQPGTARTQAVAGDELTFDDITEVPVVVTLSRLYHGAKITQDDLSLGIVDFGAQVTANQVAAVAEAAEDELAAVMNALSIDASFEATPADIDAQNADTRAIISLARETLTRNKVPLSDRFLACSPEVTSRILALPEIVKTNEAGTDSALRDAIVARYMGFNVLETPALATGKAVAYHRTGFGFGAFAPTAPKGAQSSAVVSSAGIALLSILDYLPTFASDASLLLCYAGANVVDTDRVVALDSLG